MSANFLILFIGKFGIFKLGFVFKIEREIRVRADANIESDVVRENVFGATTFFGFDAEIVGDLIKSGVEFDICEAVINFTLEGIWEIVSLGGSIWSALGWFIEDICTNNNGNGADDEIKCGNADAD